MARPVDDEWTKEVVIAFAQNNMSQAKTAKELLVDHSAIHYQLKKAKKMYGLDPKKFFDLCKILIQIEKERMNGN